MGISYALASQSEARSRIDKRPICRGDGLPAERRDLVLPTPPRHAIAATGKNTGRGSYRAAVPTPTHSSTWWLSVAAFFPAVSQGLVILDLYGPEFRSSGRASGSPAWAGSQNGASGLHAPQVPLPRGRQEHGTGGKRCAGCGSSWITFSPLWQAHGTAQDDPSPWE